MIRFLTLILAGLCLTAATVDAHHSYAAFDREHPISIEGVIERVVFANPHVILTVNDGHAVYSVEWGTLNQMARWSIGKDTLATGDRVIVTGSAPRDPDDHRLSIITAIRRTSDGWNWGR